MILHLPMVLGPSAFVSQFNYSSFSWKGGFTEEAPLESKKQLDDLNFNQKLYCLRDFNGNYDCNTRTVK